MMVDEGGVEKHSNPLWTKHPALHKPSGPFFSSPHYLLMRVSVIVAGNTALIRGAI